ncbi:MAG: electron transport complex subunit RsxE [Firmicutes bacterium]|uniref:Electron transport complex subunit RsxE n=1 Tax=Candidatus Scatoplasma merdavium TaxID=2840932 RepID=A0A9D9D9K2_9BACL|nr:electron transport complex subunit RsxE [Candidatus Scatoplasma merdavium]
MEENVKKKGACKKIFLAGILSENPILALTLGLCPTIIATQSLDNAIGMSVAVLFVLFFSNTIVSLIRKLIPSEIRIPVYIVIIASLVTCVQLLMQAFMPTVAESLGEFLPLITVNCIILGRAEAFAGKNTVGHSMLDALGMSCGFAIACIVIALFREFLGTGGWTLTNPFDSSMSVSFLPLADYKISLMVQAPGGFLWIGIIIGLFKLMLEKIEKRQLQKQMKLAPNK